MNNLKEASKQTLSQLIDLLENIEDYQYNLALRVFRGGNIGKHVRHIIEFYLCLFNDQDTTVNYDLRARDLSIETDKNIAIDKIKWISDNIDNVDVDKTISLQTNYTLDKDSHSTFNTSFLRELAYNLEHTIHHMAILRIGIESFLPEYKFPESFGIALSTLRDQKTVARV